MSEDLKKRAEEALKTKEPFWPDLEKMEFAEAILKLLEEKRELREGLRFYAKQDNWGYVKEGIAVDQGLHARELLERIKE